LNNRILLNNLRNFLE